MGFGERIRACRENKGYTQKHVAEKLNIKNSSLSMIESGKYEPSLEVLKNIAEFYNVTVDYLLGKSDDSAMTEEQYKQLDEETKRILYMLEQIDPEERLVLESMMRAYVETKLATKKKSGD